MSGGFFRGTTADQDTRFSNKQAKLLKSQKFAPELEHLVDVSKVKMDVVRPWIANRVTELLGFEDEVLINFIYGLLDGKDVNGKEIQIQITGFMEKNTGRFMKELWGLLLSAQKNASGVPQQFLDAKEEEIRKKKVEADRITLEIQKKEEVQQEKLKKTDNKVDISVAADDASYPVSKHLPRRASSAHPEEDKESDERNGSRRNDRFSRSPPSADRSLSSERDRHKSRSISRSPQSQGCSVSPEMRYRSPRKHSMSPRKYSPRRPRSPLRRRSPQSRHRTSSPSPRRRKSPSFRRRRSPSPRRRRSPTPRRRRPPSPMRRRSPSPRRRRSPSPKKRTPFFPARRRSPSPVRHRSPPPMRRRSRSPLRRRRSPTPSQQRSPSPLRGRSPSPRWRRSLSPMRSPPPRSAKQWRKSPLRSPRQRNRSRSPYKSHSPAYQSRRSLSRDCDIRINGAGSKRPHDDHTSQRTHGKRSPAHHEDFERSDQGRQGSDSVARLPPISLRSPQRDPKDWSDVRKKIHVLSPSPEKSPSRSESSPRIGKSSPSEDRNRSPSESPVRRTGVWVSRHDSPKTNREKESSLTRGDGDRRIDSPRKRTRHSPTVGGQRNIPTKDFDREEFSPEGFTERRSGEARSRLDNIALRKKDQDRKSEKASTRTGSAQRSSHTLEEIEYGPGRIEGERFSLDRAPYELPSAKKLKRDSPSSERFQKSNLREDYRADEKRSRPSNVVDGRDGKTESVQKSMKNIDHNTTFDSDSEENEKKISEQMEKKKHKRSGRRKVASDDDTSSDSRVDERKEAKRRRKEEKRLRKEEKRRRREERHRKRGERRACKLKAKSMETVNLPSDIEKNGNDADSSDGDVAAKRDSHLTDGEETESEQKKLEIELRKKALESLRAKKGINP